MTSLFPISKTSASYGNLHKTEEESRALNEALATNFPSKLDPSPCLTLTFLALFHIPNLHARRIPITRVLAPQSTIASTFSPPISTLTVRRGVGRGVRPTAGDVLLTRFLNPPQNRAL